MLTSVNYGHVHCTFESRASDSMFYALTLCALLIVFTITITNSYKSWINWRVATLSAGASGGVGGRERGRGPGPVENSGPNQDP